MFQPDLFIHEKPAGEGAISRRINQVKRHAKAALPVASGPSPLAGEELDLPGILERLAGVSARPRYTYMVLTLIARAAGQSDSAGPYVREAGALIPVRDWLTAALMPMAQRDARRRAVVAEVRADLEHHHCLPQDPDQAERAINDKVRTRLLHSGRTNVSRAVSDLVRAGLVRRHYQGFRVDHENRGAQREAVYTITPAVRRVLGQVG
ncbi:hypothetical protein [Novosphingobium sp. Leaf2]|uniref:hypothetical protein n=1 Tax=Novosphingobium sp. Leaf2 TaxID=1735670 RepID=UPI003FA5A24E